MTPRRGRATLPGLCAVGLASLVVGAAAAPPARADVIFELAPTVGAGATASVYPIIDPMTQQVSQQHFDASFTSAGGAMRLRYRTAKSDHNLGVRALYTQYLVSDGSNIFTGNAAAGSGFNLTQLWMLRLGAGVTLTRSSGSDFGDPSTVLPQALVGGTFYYVATNASQDLAYQPSPRRGYGETLSFSRLQYLDPPSPVQGMAGSPAGAASIVLPNTDVFTLALRANRMVGRENYTLNVSIADAYTETVVDAPATSYEQGNNFYGAALVGWQHEFNPFWSTLLQAGPAVVFRLDRGVAMAPAGTAIVNYRRVPWYASLSASQVPTANLYVGGAVVTDQLMARVALPLTKSERFFVGGYGGYTYARTPGSGDLFAFERNYDQFMGGASLSARFPRLPISASLAYVALTQRGNASANMNVPDLARQSVWLSITSELAWGPGTPPLFGGAL